MSVDGSGPNREGEQVSSDLYRNEFAMVEVGRFETPSGARLRILDVASGDEIYLDALELEGLTRARHRHFAPLLDPSELRSAHEPDPDQV